MNRIEAIETSPETLKRPARSIIVYAIIAYLISWAIEIPLALVAQGVYSWDIPFWIHYCAAFGPGTAAVLLTWRDNGTSGLQDLFGRCVQWKVGFMWWIVALSPLLIFFLIAIVMRLFGGTPLKFGILDRVDFLPDIGPAVVLVWLATFGFGEEVGWRGYLLPRLQRSRSAWTATLILWMVWATWHVPSFFYLHTVNSLGSLFGFLLGMLAGAVFLTWLYNSTSGSLLIVAVWHGLFDYVTACTECKSGLVAAVVSTLVMVWAIVVLVLFKRTNLSQRQRQKI